ncbi:MAG: 2-hydroxyhepta-2,4-diene-1,7-dioate isomerase [Flavobacteriaceae bacterium]|nr:2-hydroxyhepta-2,4-diene-1,7-dioate isomerase [Flavobacteriaceae bacterium]|tara:strand:+ start:2925 stop:3536 length:612 start_codon:yes stop_codon:yes gene_type:complete
MKLICIGSNYEKHIDELGNIIQEHPVVFLKPDSAVINCNQPFFIPDIFSDIHHELELLVKINKVGKYIDKEFAHTYYDKIGLGLDFTARDLQNKLKLNGLPWEKAKAFDGSALIGKWVSKSNFKNLSNINFSLKKNQFLVQIGNTSDMMWGIDEIISYISRYFTLKIGDIIFTGTPSGVGPVFSGDILKGYIENEEFFSIKIK